MIATSALPSAISPSRLLIPPIFTDRLSRRVAESRALLLVAFRKVG
jgi:hypothetical protein